MDVTRVSVLGDGVRPGVVISVRVVEEEEAAAEEVAAEEEEEEEEGNATHKHISQSHSILQTYYA